MEALFGKDIEQLGVVAVEAGLPKFAARQIAEWLYRKGVTEIAEMSNISLVGRAALSEKYEIGLRAPLSVAVSADGTKKYLYPTSQGGIESVYIPDGDRGTLCISSQSGCRMGCVFCATGQMGLIGNPSSGEIVNQYASLPEREAITNIVYMGMGEPLDNVDEVLRSLRILTSDWGYGLSPSRITLSTAGVIPAMERFLMESSVHLAVSLHSAVSSERATLMPIEKVYPIEEVIEILRRADFSHQRRVSFEYIILEGINDSMAHIKALTKLLNGLPCRINIIRFHRIPSSPYFSPSDERVIEFRNALTKRGIQTTIRASRGEDIAAACGLLAGGK